MMLMPNNAVDRLIAYGKGLGLDDGPVGIKSEIDPAIELVPETDQYQPDSVDLIALANTSDIDLDDEVVVPSGANRTYISKNGKVFANHNYENDDVVGHLRWIRAYPDIRNHRAWQVRIKLTSLEAGRTARTIVEETGSIGLSVGFYAREYGPPSADEKALYRRGSKEPASVVRAWDWFELSLTAMPCNVACQTQSVIESEKHLADIERLVTKGVISRRGASSLGMPITPKRMLHAVSPVGTKRLLVPGGVIVTKG